MPLKRKSKKTGLKDPIKANLIQAQNELDVAYSNFENVLDPDLIDAAIYEMNALHKRYCFFLKKARTLNNSNI